MNYTLLKEVKETGARTKYKLYGDSGVILKLDLPFSLEIIEDDLALYTTGSYNDPIDVKKMVIFDLASGKVICDKFNKIYPFQDFDGEKRARADIYIKHHNKVITISCIIDIKGNIVSKVIDNKDCIPFEPALLDNHINFIKKSLEEEDNQFKSLLQNEEEKVLKLIRQKR